MTDGLPAGITPYDWALEQLRIPDAHAVTKGSENVVVAVIDLGYRHHSDLDGHLWVNPNPKQGDIHGWDCVDDDSSLEYNGPGEEDSYYYRGHHVFVAGEVAAVAPECPIMIVRVGYTDRLNWANGIRYAVDNGAKVLVIPHGYIGSAHGSDIPLFYQGTDFGYPRDNPELRRALDYAYDSGCLVMSGTADNRGRRVVAAQAAFDTTCAVGSSHRRGAPANICCSADYVEFGAPGGDRGTGDDRDRIWGCGGDGQYIPFEGGCMACAFAGGVAALVWSRYPDLSNEQVRQIMRNTARPAESVEYNADGWEPRLGYGILDAAAAVSLRPGQLCRDIHIVEPSLRVADNVLRAVVENRGAYDADRAVVVAYSGDSRVPADSSGTTDTPAQELLTRQIGHAVVVVRGLHSSRVSVELLGAPPEVVYLETFTLDRHDVGNISYSRWAKEDTG